MADRFLTKRFSVAAVAATAVIFPAFALEITWNEIVDAKGCDGNWYQVQRARNMRQCLENGKPLHCSSEEIQQKCRHHFDRRQNGHSGQPERY